MSISSQSVTELRNKCGLSLQKCQAALKQHGGNVEAALAALIDSGQVKLEDLNPDTVSDALFERVAHREQVEALRNLGSMLEQLLGDVGTEMSQEVGQLFTKTPEELLAQTEKAQAKRGQQLAKVLPGLRRESSSAGQQARLLANTKRRSEWIKAHPFTLRLPPFPPLKRELDEWTGRDVLSAWAGTQERLGAYTSVSSSKRSKGTVLVQIPRLGQDDADPRPPAPEQIAAYTFFKENQVKIAASLLKALLRGYNKLRRRWLKDNPKLKLPEISSVDQMRKNVGLGIVHMHGIAKNGFAYVGLELGCTWDEEHGAGVLLHKGRIVAIGQADTSFDSYAALDDGGVELHE